MIKDVILALEIAEDYLEKGNWVRIQPPTRLMVKFSEDVGNTALPTWMYIGTIHDDGFLECHHTSYMIHKGVAVKHVLQS